MNKYLIRAMHLKDKKYSIPARAMGGTLGYMDRVLGLSATKVRTMANTATKLSNNTKITTPGLSRHASRLDALAKGLEVKSRNTRIKTGLVIGGSVLAHRANKNLSNEENYYQPAYYQTY